METVETPSGRDRRSLYALLGLLLVAFFLMDIALGPVHIPLGAVIRITLGTGQETNEVWRNIVLEIRLPKALTALLVGAAIAGAGLAMQTLFRNPLAGPDVLGLSAGASLGVAAVLLAAGGVSKYAIAALGLGGSWLLVLAATAGAALVLLLVLAISTRVKDPVILLIVGLMMSSITLSIVSVWQYFAAPQALQDYLIWTFGSLGGTTGPQLGLLAVVVGLGLLLIFAAAKALDALLLGENYARSSGINLRLARWLIIGGASLLAGSITAFCGPIGFLGVAVPHLTRGLFRQTEHRRLLPACCLLGALLMLICDLFTALPGTQALLPVNAVAALIGAPVVIAVVLRAQNFKSGF